MKIVTKKTNLGIHVDYELNETEIDVLEYMKTKNFIEWKKNNINENNENNEKLDTTGQFKYSDCSDLIDYKFIVMVIGCWQIDYELGWRGKAFLGLPFEIDEYEGI